MLIFINYIALVSWMIDFATRVCHFSFRSFNHVTCDQTIKSNFDWISLFIVLEERQRDEDTENEHRGEKFEQKIDRNGSHKGSPVERSRILTMDTDISRTDAPTRIVRHSQSMKRRRFVWLLRYVRCQFGEWRSPHQGFVPIWIAGT